MWLHNARFVPERCAIRESQRSMSGPNPPLLSRTPEADPIGPGLGAAGTVLEQWRSMIDTRIEPVPGSHGLLICQYVPFVQTVQIPTQIAPG